MRALVGADSKQRRLLFQLCNNAHTLERRGLITLIFSAATFTRLQQPGINVANSLCAVVKEGKLEFTKYFTVRQFIDLTFESYGEATTAEIIGVLSKDSVFSGDIDEITVSKICDKPTRKHFQKVIQDAVMDHPNMTGEKLAKLSEQFEFELEATGRKGHRRLVLPADKAKMKRLILLLNQKIFQSAITEELCETNSFKKLKKKQ